MGVELMKLLQDGDAVAIEAMGTLRDAVISKAGGAMPRLFAIQVFGLFDKNVKIGNGLGDLEEDCGEGVTFKKSGIGAQSVHFDTETGEYELKAPSDFGGVYAIELFPYVIGAVLSDQDISAVKVYMSSSEFVATISEINRGLMFSVDHNQNIVGGKSANWNGWFDATSAFKDAFAKLTDKKVREFKIEEGPKSDFLILN